MEPLPCLEDAPDWPDLREYALRCRPALARLYRLSCLQSSAPLPPVLLDEGRMAVEQIRAELDAALSALRAAGTGTGGHRLLVTRVIRLRLAADAMGRAVNRPDQVTDLRGLRGLLAHFDALVAALWTVQFAVSPDRASGPVIGAAGEEPRL
ncbi:hypothetical protein [Actinomadura vinacea]